MKPKQGAGSGTYGPGSIPTKPMQPRVQEPADPPTDEGEDTQQRCPLCVGHGYVPPNIGIAFEAWCAKLHAEQEE